MSEHVDSPEMLISMMVEDTVPGDTVWELADYFDWVVGQVDSGVHISDIVREGGLELQTNASVPFTDWSVPTGRAGIEHEVMLSVVLGSTLEVQGIGCFGPPEDTEEAVEYYLDYLPEDVVNELVQRRAPDGTNLFLARNHDLSYLPVAQQREEGGGDRPISLDTCSCGAHVVISGSEWNPESPTEATCENCKKTYELALVETGDSDE